MEIQAESLRNISNLENQLKVGNPDYDAMTKLEEFMKDKFEQVKGVSAERGSRQQQTK